MRLLGKIKRQKDSVLAKVPTTRSRWSIVDLHEQPKSDPFACNCDSRTFWEDIAGSLHCIECKDIPARRMVAGFWSAVGDEWQRYNPGWNPFQHLDDEQRAIDEREALIEGGQF